MIREPFREVLLGVGLAAVRFGADRDEVRRHWGAPQQIEMLDFLANGTMLAEQWQYPNRGISADFHADDNYRLGSLEVSTPTYTICGRTLIGQSEQTVLRVLEDLGYGPYQREDLIVMAQVVFDDVNLTLLFHDSILQSIQWGYLWIDENTPAWPIYEPLRLC